MKNALEDHRFFPYIAWTVFIGFAVFVYFTTVNLSKDFEYLSTEIELLEQSASADSSEELHI